MFSDYSANAPITYGVDEEGHQMTLYEAPGDSRTNRPAIILMGGGGFDGTNLSLLEPLAANLVKYGAVVALITYRVIDSQDGTTRLINAQQDSRAAVRYLRKEAQNLNISSTNIFIGGNGSGAFSALFHAYIDESDMSTNELTVIQSLGGLEGEDQGNSEFSSEAKGIISLAGGMFSSLESITNEDIPIFAIHGTADAEVPYDTESTTPTTYGSKPITDKVAAVGLSSHLFTIQNGSHSAPRERSDDYILDVMYFVRATFD